MSENMIKISDESFDKDVLQAEKPVLVDFWAEWCSPCKMIAPVLEEVANEYADKLIIGKVDIDNNHESPAKYGVRGIPTLILFHKGNVVATKVGALTKSQLTEFLDSNL